MSWAYGLKLNPSGPAVVSRHKMLRRRVGIVANHEPRHPRRLGAGWFRPLTTIQPWSESAKSIGPLLYGQSSRRRSLPGSPGVRGGLQRCRFRRIEHDPGRGIGQGDLKRPRVGPRPTKLSSARRDRRCDRTLAGRRPVHAPAVASYLATTTALPSVPTTGVVMKSSWPWTDPGTGSAVLVQVSPAVGCRPERMGVRQPAVVGIHESDGQVSIEDAAVGPATAFTVPAVTLQCWPSSAVL